LKELTALWLLLARALPGEEDRDFAGPGPHPVGVRMVTLVDEERKDEFAGGPRTLITEIWYPATEEARSRPPMRFREFFGPYPEEGARALRRDLAEVDRDFRTQAVRNAPLKAGRWPLLIFSHGNGGFRHQNVFQMDHLASHGYLVASPDHTGNSKLSPLPDRAVRYDRRGKGQSAQDRPRDVRFLIDRILAPSGPAVAWLEGATDPAAVGVLGHSFGGFTAVRVVEEDPRVKAILAMTVAFTGRPTAVPTLVMLGAQDSTIGRAGNLLSRGYFLGCTGPRYLLTLRRGGHFTFTDMDLIHPNFGDGVGRGKGLNGEEVEFLPAHQAKRIINSYTIAFFERYLRGSEAAGQFLLKNHHPDEAEWWVGDLQVKNSASSP